MNNVIIFYMFKRWMQPCSDIDLKMSLLASQEQELQDLSNQNSGLKKVLEKLNKEVSHTYPILVVGTVIILGMFLFYFLNKNAIISYE